MRGSTRTSTQEGVNVVETAALDASTVDDALGLADEWGYGHDEFRNLVRFSDGCSRLAYADEEAIAMSFGFPWEPVGWIGSVLTLEAHRGQGIGQRIVEECVEALTEHGCRTVKLYSTPKAIPLYERIGFQGEAEHLIVKGSPKEGRDPDVVPLTEHADAMKRLDRKVFPGDRTAFLADVLERNPDVAVGVLDADGELAGYAMARPGPSITELGPVVVREGDANRAQALVDGILTRLPDQPVELIHPKGSWAASTSWGCRGFVTVDTPLEMRLGPPVEEHRDAIVAGGGQEVG